MAVVATRARELGGWPQRKQAAPCSSLDKHRSASAAVRSAENAYTVHHTPYIYTRATGTGTPYGLYAKPEGEPEPEREGRLRPSLGASTPPPPPGARESARAAPRVRKYCRATDNQTRSSLFGWGYFSKSRGAMGVAGALPAV
jgi:hypothetical protein